MCILLIISENFLLDDKFHFIQIISIVKNVLSSQRFSRPFALVLRKKFGQDVHPPKAMAQNPPPRKKSDGLCLLYLFGTTFFSQNSPYQLQVVPLTFKVAHLRHHGRL
jgi:hypothetical protein